MSYAAQSRIFAIAVELLNLPARQMSFRRRRAFLGALLISTRNTAKSAD